MKPLILVVDDGPTDVKLVSQVLLWEGCRVLDVASAEEALGVLRDILPDLVLFNVALELPDLDGLRLARLLREDERTRHLPIVVLGPQAMKEEITRAATGCDCLPRPIDTRKFCQLIEQRIAPGPSFATPSFS